ncbi:MAG TPA: TonB family protein [Steroidobacteraceae bacterium]|jgi:TonB family protein|nr:TonB family protein [Steroidobacteraceae bacterium]
MTSQRIKLLAQSAVVAFIAAMVLDRPDPAQGAAVEKVELPAYNGTLRDDYYPPDARQHFLQGRALVEFSLNGSGVPADVVVVASEPPREFEKSARLLVKNLRFEIPAGWEATAAAARRFRIGVRFQVVDCLNFSHCQSEARNPPPDYGEANRTYIVTAQRRVLTFDNQPPAAPVPPQTSEPAAPASPYPVPRPQSAPPASAEPIYPPG